MFRGRSPIILFQHKMQIPNLVQNNRVIDQASFVDFVQLLDCIVFFEVETKHTIHALS